MELVQLRNNCNEEWDTMYYRELVKVLELELQKAEENNEVIFDIQIHSDTRFNRRDGNEFKVYRGFIIKGTNNANLTYREASI